MADFILDIDTKFLSNLAQADNRLKDMINSANMLTQSLTAAFSTVGAQNQEWISRMQTQWQSLSNTKVSPQFDVTKAAQFLDTVNTIIAGVQQITSQKGDVQIFDTKGLQATTQNMFQIEGQINTIKSRITELKTEWATINVAGRIPDDFQAPVNKRTGRAYSEKTKTYQEALEMARRTEKERIESELRVLIESQAIENKKLQWSKMTLDQRAEYVRKAMDDMLKAESQAAQQAKQEYSQVTSEMMRIMRDSDKISKKNKTGAADEQIKALENRFAELNTRRVQLENSYGYAVVDVAKRVNAQVLSIEANRILEKQQLDIKAADAAKQAYLTSPKGALEYASNAKTWEEKEKAQKYVLEARKKTNEADAATVKQLESAYISLTSAIEKNKQALKSEQTLQPSLANEYVRLQKELEKLKASRQSLASMGSAGTQADTDLLNRQLDIESKIQQIKLNGGALIAEADRKLAAEKATMEVSLAEETERNKLELARNRYQQELSEARKNGTISIDSANRLIRATDTAKNVAQDEAAIKRLKDAITHLNKDQAGYEETVRKLNERIRQHEENIKRSTRTTEEQAEADRKAAKASEDKARALRESKIVSDPKAAIENSKAAQSIREQVEALRLLKAARDNMSRNGYKSEREYQKAVSDVNNEIKRQEDSIKRLKGEQDKLKNNSGELGNMLKNAFSVYAIRNYVNQMVRIHGEFEIIQKSLAVLVGSEADAALMWEKISTLALKSPFQVQELATATKQMAAYRIETDQLYRKTKMLADISAGLGVQISRLILAYGQVKAANFLRGTELRQFSEAGIDMLGQLSLHFSQLEERAVSVAEVFDRISKRQVLFEDVDKVLQNVTSVGGAFYKMQEEQAKTIKGQISNLKDQMALAFDEMGRSQHGVITTYLSVLKFLISNWQIILSIIGPLITAFLTYKATVALCSAGSKLWATAGKALSVVLSLLTGEVKAATASFKALDVVMKSNIIGLIISLLAMAVSYFIVFRESATDAGEAVVTFSGVIDENAESIKTLNTLIAESTKKYNELKDAVAKANETGERNVDAENELASVERMRAGYLSELSRLNKEYAQSIIEVIGDEERLKALLEDNTKEMQARSVVAAFFNGIDFQKFGELSGDLLTRKTIASAGQDLWDSFIKELKGDPESLKKEFDKFSEEVFGFVGKEGSIFRVDNIIQGLKDEIVRIAETETDFKEASASLKKALDVFDYEIREGGGGSLGDYKINQRTGLTEALFGNALSQALYFERHGIEKVERGLDDTLKAIDDGIEAWKASEWGKAKLIEWENAVTEEDKNKVVKDIQDMFSYVFALVELEGEGLKVAQARVAKALFHDTWRDFQPPYQEWQKRYNSLLETIAEAEVGGVKALRQIDMAFSSVSSSTKAEDKIKELDEAIKKYKEIIESTAAWSAKYGANWVNMPFMWTKEDADEAQRILPFLEKLREFFGDSDKDKKKRESPYKDLLKSIEDVHKAYKEMEKTLSKDVAITGAWERYGDAMTTALSKVGMSVDEFKERFGDLDTEDEFTSALEWLATQARDIDEKFDILRVLGEYKWELKLEEDAAAFDDTMRQVEEMFSGYELSIELDKLHLPKDFARDFFNIDILSIEDLRKKMIDLLPQFQGTEELKKYEEYLAKIDEMEVKAQQERIKKYQEFTRKAISERAKIMLDSFYELQEIKKAFQMTNTMALNKGLIDENIKRALDSTGKSISDLLELSDSEIMDDWFITEDQIALLREFNGELQRQRDLAKEGANQKTKTELDKEAWEQFQTTDTFQMLMSDLENMSEAAIGKMIEQLERYKEQWKDMPVSDIKQLVDTIEKLKDAQAAFKTPRELKRVLEGYLSEGVDVQDEETGITTATYHFDSVTDAQNQLVDSELRIQALEEELALVEEIEALRATGVDDAAILNQLKSQGLHSEEAISNALKKSSKELKANIYEENNRKIAASKVVGVTEDIQASYKEQADRIKKVQDLTNSLFDGWEAINSLFEDDSISSFLLDMSSSILDGVLNMIMLQGETFAATVAAEGLGAAINAAMGPIGWIVLAIQVLTKALKFAFEQHDKNLQKQIDAQQEKVEKLQKAYEKLERQIEKAYMSADLGRLTREAEENLQRQIDATEKMIALEEDKKKTDKDAIKDWKDDIDDMRESIEELHEETFSTLTDGVLDNVLDATRGFVDAWHDAFLEAGDGVKGLKDSFKDMMQSIVRQQASMTILGPFIDQLKGKLNQYVNTYDTMLDPAEAADLKQWFENNKDSMNESLEAYFGAFNSLFDGSGELSDLEKGLQGMTEDQAEVLAAYWNSCRFMLSNIDTTLTRMAANVLDTSGENNPIVSALNAQTEVITAIKDMFSSVIETGNGVQHNGAYLKVFMP